MKRDQIVSLLRRIDSLVAECLQALGEKSNSAIARKSGSSPKAIKNALPDKIIDLRDKGFLVQPKTARDVQAKLAATYICEVDRVSMALLRLVERKKLRKAFKLVSGKKQVAYVW
jgi:hypothetical protein